MWQHHSVALSPNPEPSKQTLLNKNKGMMMNETTFPLIYDSSVAMIAMKIC